MRRSLRDLCTASHGPEGLVVAMLGPTNGRSVYRIARRDRYTRHEVTALRAGGLFRVD